MVENGFVFAVNKSYAKKLKQDVKNSIKHEKFLEVILKHNVNCSERFSIKEWNKSDIMKLYKNSVYTMRLLTFNDNDKIQFSFNNEII
ncbi:hypothetical protein G9F71_008410 [Clostridium sp. FP2]|uniref:hypothetical protein n=1 Tax=Clostridium sp. FP2 TaxID=2724481 RepID=UPI0013E91167|nr:hypothetical protein [Clostridium sp. FP2]MBZ9622874.1 hypothetical protein [Clostridium sp. FP2]